MIYSELIHKPVESYTETGTCHTVYINLCLFFVARQTLFTLTVHIQQQIPHECESYRIRALGNLHRGSIVQSRCSPECPLRAFLDQDQPLGDFQIAFFGSLTYFFEHQFIIDHAILTLSMSHSNFDIQPGVGRIIRKLPYRIVTTQIKLASFLGYPCLLHTYHEVPIKFFVRGCR